MEIVAGKKLKSRREQLHVLSPFFLFVKIKTYEWSHSGGRITHDGGGDKNFSGRDGPWMMS